MLFSREDSVSFHIGPDSFKDRKVLDNPEDNPFRAPKNIRINIEKSESGKTSLTQTYTSQGKTFKIALQNAQNIAYSYTINDNVLMFSPRLQLKKNVNWRAQEVSLTLKVPVGTKLVLKQDAYRYINNFYAWSCNDNQNNSDDFSTWIMTDEGLKCKYEIDHPKPIEENQENN